MSRKTEGTPNAKRIYAIVENGDFVALVRAASQAQAIRHVVGDRYEAIVADQDHLVTLLSKGLKVQEAATAPADEGRG